MSVFMAAYILTDESGKEILALSNNFLSHPYKVNAHTHHKLEISMAKSGNGTYEIGDRVYQIRAGDIFLLGNQEPHRICLHKGQQMVNMVLHFEPEFLWSYLGQNKDIRFLNVFFSHNQKFSNRLEKENPETQKIGTYLLEIEHEFIEKRPYYDLKIKVLMETIFLNILRNFDYFKSSGNSLEFSHKDIYRMAEVIHYIDLNICLL